MNKKQYGLFIPKKNTPGGSTQFVKKPAVFDEDSNSDGESNVDWVKKSLQKEPYGGGSLTRQAKSDIQKVLAEDPTAYQYDEVYDELQKNINDNLAAKKSDRKPKYIQRLMETAKLRKRENERRLARQIQKEREAEGDEFADKEVFVTAAYKKKLEEMKKMDEEDQHTAMLEDIGDVTKQRDMVGFYRHLYRATVTKEDLQEPPPVQSKPEDKPAEEPESSKSSKPRQYRKRKSSESSDGEPEKSLEGKAAKADNPDADSDLPSSSDEDEKNEPEPPKDPAQDAPQNETDQPLPQDDKKDNDKETTEDDKKPEENDENKEPVEPPKPKVSIWVKRTVGEAFDAALQRYYERKSERLAARGS